MLRRTAAVRPPQTCPFAHRGGYQPALRIETQLCAITLIFARKNRPENSGAPSPFKRIANVSTVALWLHREQNHCDGMNVTFTRRARTCHLTKFRGTARVGTCRRHGADGHDQAWCPGPLKRRSFVGCHSHKGLDSL